MTYVLEEITLADQEKILKDAECDERKKRLLIRRDYFNKDEPPREWAVNRDKNSYLFWAPRPPMDQNSYYYFYFNNFLYALHFKSQVDCVVYFDDTPFPTPPRLTEFKQAIVNAFSAYGIIQSYTVISFVEWI
jgi:hypothetical protein